jgi:DNA-binding MarR family transcriptional regulator
MEKHPTEPATADYLALGEFRYQIRRFLHFSEEAAKSHGLEPQQHQALLAIHSSGEPEGATIGRLAERLLIRHHSAVGLVDRLAEGKLVERVRGGQDRRQVRVRLTPAGELKLRSLAEAHREELRQSGPLLVASLSQVLDHLPATAQ